MNIAFPLGFDYRGHTAESPSDALHIRDLIEQLLFTNPGERVNRPDFGTGLLQLVFAPNGSELAAATQFTVQAALQQWLGDLIDVREINVQSHEATLSVRVDYLIRKSNVRECVVFHKPGV